VTPAPAGICEHADDGGVLRWELCDPARSNPLSPAILRWIAERSVTLRGEIVMVRGRGGRVFCGGFDLRALAEEVGGLPDAPLGAAISAMRAADATFVAALDGHAIGAGVELACACDVRIGRDGIHFEIPASRLGVIYRAEGLALLQHVFGNSLVRRLVLLGERIGAVDAAAHGALDHLVAAPALEETVDAVVGGLRTGDAAALRGNRDALRWPAGPPSPARVAEHEARRARAFADARARLRARGGLPKPASSGLGLPPMAIKDDIEARTKQARRDRDEATLNVIGMIKNRVITELKSGSGTVEDDALWLSVLGAYVKQLRKAIPEFEKAGERGREGLADVQFELAFCEQFLPARLDEAATLVLVRALVAEHGLLGQGSKAAGRVMGLLMKNHRDTLDGDIAKAVVDRVLSES